MIPKLIPKLCLLVVVIAIPALLFGQAGPVTSATYSNTTRNQINSALIQLGCTTTGVCTGGGGGGMTDPTTTQGDMIYRGASGVTRLAIGTINQCVVSNGTIPTWATCTVGNDFTPTKTSGTVLTIAAGKYRSGTDTYTLGATTFTLTQYSITSISAAGSAVLTLASAPPAGSFTFGDTISILGVTGSGCSGLNNLQTVTGINSNLITISFNSTGLTCTGGTFGANSSAVASAYVYGNYDGTIHLELPASAGLIAVGTGTFITQQTTTPSFIQGSLPIASLTLIGTNNGNWNVLTDSRAYMGTYTTQAGTGMNVTKSGGVNTVSIDTAIVPRLGQSNTWTGVNDFTAATSTSPSKAGTTLPATCVVGQSYVKTDAATTAQWNLCTSINTWTAQGSAGSYTLPAATTSALGGIILPSGGCPLGQHWNGTLSAGVAVCTADAGGSGSFDPMDTTIAYERDEFQSGTNGAQGNKPGDLNWSPSASTGAMTWTYLTSEDNHPGLLEISTDNIANDTALLSLSSNAGNPNIYRVNLTNNWDIKFIIKVPTITSVRAYVGGGTNAAPGYNIVGFKYVTDDGDTTWKCAASTGYTTSSTDTTTTVVAGTYYTLRVWSTTIGTINCSVNGGSTYTVSTNIPTVNVYPQVSLLTLGSAIRTMDIDFFAMKQTVTR